MLDDKEMKVKKMMGHPRKPEDESWRGINDDRVDRELDAALAKYAAVEPRAGFEERILANLRTKREGASVHECWRWTAVAALAAILTVVALSLVFRPAHQQQGAVLHSPSTATQHDGIPDGTQVAAKPASVQKHTKRTLLGLPAVATTGPRLEQFPSPQPLSEQEKILESYIANYPEHAVLVARARTEELRRDEVEEMNYGAGTNEKDSQQ